jgi:hypothetical protein
MTQTVQEMYKGSIILRLLSFSNGHSQSIRWLKECFQSFIKQQLHLRSIMVLAFRIYEAKELKISVQDLDCELTARLCHWIWSERLALRNLAHWWSRVNNELCSLGTSDWWPYGWSLRNHNSSACVSWSSYRGFVDLLFLSCLLG